MIQPLTLLFRFLVIFVTGIAPVLAGEAAEEIPGFSPVLSCPIAKVSDHDDVPVYFFHYQFLDSNQDLAVAKPIAGKNTDIRRVTFAGSKATCLSNGLAIAKGGDWGWHLLWLLQDGAVLRYARMDGEAWVISPSKVLAKHAQPLKVPVILTSGQRVWVVWVEADSNTYSVYAVYSDDEGRNWQDVRLIVQTPSMPSGMYIVEKGDTPYLTGQGLAGLVPLKDR